MNQYQPVQPNPIIKSFTSGQEMRPSDPATPKRVSFGSRDGLTTPQIMEEAKQPMIDVDQEKRATMSDHDFIAKSKDSPNLLENINITTSRDYSKDQTID